MRDIATEPTAAGAALQYATLGIPVFPCVAGGKQPLTPNGFHDATSSADAVRRWWQRHPEANIGLPTGAITGVVVVDVDVHATGTGYTAFERARAAGLAEGWGWLVRTPSGGLHAYYPARPGSQQRSWQVPSAHVDFRGDGGYIIAPPSRTEIDGQPKAYEVLAVAHHEARPVDAITLRQFLEPPRRILLGPGRPAIGSRPEQLASWVATRPDGARNGGLFWAACRMVEHGHDYAETLTVLGQAAQAAGLPEQEAATTIRSAYRTASRRADPPTLAPADPPSGSRLDPTGVGEEIRL
jgi:hypothetical protein